MMKIYPRKLIISKKTGFTKFEPLFKARHFVLVAILLFLCFSCKKAPATDAGSVAGQNDSVFADENIQGGEEESPVPTGIPISVQGKRLSPDGVTQPRMVPLGGNPKILPAHPNVQLAGQPKVIPIVEQQLTVVTPGKNGVPLPESKPATGKVVQTLQPRPVPSLPLRSKDETIANFQYLEMDLAIGSDKVGTIMEDSRGNIWLGTNAGAIRYDGKWLTLYSEKEGMSHNMIRSIIEDRNGNIWFATWRGVTCYDGTNFIHFTEKEGMSSDKFYSMMEDSKGNMWFGTWSGGLIRYDGTNFTFFTEKNGLNDKSVYSMMEDSKGKMWFGTVEGGVSCFDGTSFIHYTEKDGLPSNLVYSITEDRQGNIWFGTYKGASCFDGESFTNFTKAEGLMGNFVKSIFEDKDGNLWISNATGSTVTNRGVSRFDGKTFTHFTEKEGLANDLIWKIKGDKKGNIWFATNKGVTRLEPQGFFHFAGQNGLEFQQMVSSILEDRLGNLWLGSWVGGLIRFDGEHFTHLNTGEGLRSDVINKIITDKKGNLWFDIGTRGVTRLDAQGFNHFPSQKSGANLFMPFCQDRHGNLWFKADGGLICQDSLGYVLFDDKAVFGDFNINGGVEGSQGHLWFGTSGGGAIKYDGAAFTRLTENEGLISNQINDIFKDRQGNLWFLTDAGLDLYDGAGFTHFTEKEGLGNHVVYAMTEDSSGNIWVNRYGGLSVLIPKNNWPNSVKRSQLADFTPQTADYCIVNFEKEDGWKCKSARSIFLDRTKRLWVGSEAGLTHLDTDKFNLGFEPLTLQFEHIEIMQQFMDFRRLADTAYQNSFSFGKDIALLAGQVTPFYNYPASMTLPSDLNHLTFYFSASSLDAQHKIQYSYFIENVDKTWSVPQAEPKAEYRNLPFGTHTIQVKANRDGIVWSKPIEYTFTILPPWYRTWLAYLLYSLTGAALLFGIRHYELRRQLARAEARRLKELDAVKTRLYTNITHEFRTPLTVINGMADKLQGQVDFSAREGLKLIQRNGRQLLDLINQMLDLAKLESGSLPVNRVQGDVIVFLKYLLESFHSLADAKNISLKFTAQQGNFHMDFDPEKLRQIMTNLLQNAIKFTGEGGKVEVKAEAGDRQIRIEVNDNGRGIPASQLEQIFNRFHQVDDSVTRSGAGTGIGLTLTRELTKLLGGQISVESELGVGTQFTVLLPVTRKAAAILPEVLEVEDLTSIQNVSNPNSPSEQSISIIRPTLLLIEDNPDVVQYVSLLLKNEYRLFIAPNGKLGLEKALAEIPDLIISDVMMPEMDGYEACRKLKNDLATSHIPVVLLTARSDFESRLEGLELGADAYLAKPFKEKELKVVLKKLLDNRERLRQFYTSGEFFEKRESSPIAAIKLPAKDREFLQQLQAVMEANLGNSDFSSEILCEQLFMSYNTCLRKVKALTGMSVNEYIQHTRIIKAAQWLREDASRFVVEIAESAGYSSPSYFNRVFKQMMGVTPTEYRDKGIRK